MLKFIIPILTIISLCLLAILLNITTPSSVGPFGILMVFLLTYLSSFGLMTTFLFGSSKVIWHAIEIFFVKVNFKPLTLSRAAFFSSIIATAPVMLLALRSVGVVSWYGYSLVSIFVLIGCIYVSRKTV